MAVVSTTLFGDLVFLPLQTEAPAKEILSWKTDVIEAHNGLEDRLSIRNAARRRFEYKLPTAADFYQNAFNTLYGSRDSDWAIPAWSELQLVGAISAGQSSIVLTTDVYDFRNDSLALIWESKTNWQVVEIQTVNAGSIDLYGTTNLFTQAYVVPVRRGHIASGSLTRTTNSYNAVFSVPYDLDDNVPVADVIPDQYLSDDIYYDEGLLGGVNLKENLIDKVQFIDEQTGLVNYRSQWLNTKLSRPFGFVLETPAEVASFREFIYRRRGRFRAFWQPSFDNDFRNQSAGALTTVITVASDQYRTHAQDRDHIAIELNNGTWLPRQIIDSTVINAQQIELTLDSSIAVDASEIVRISYLGLKRFETDVVDMNWVGGGVCRSQIRMLELSP